MEESIIFVVSVPTILTWYSVISASDSVGSFHTNVLPPWTLQLGATGADKKETKGRVEKYHINASTTVCMVHNTTLKYTAHLNTVLDHMIAGLTCTYSIV